MCRYACFRLQLAIVLSKQTKAFGNHRKLCKRADLELLYQLVPVEFDRPLRNAQLKGNLLVRPPVHEQTKDLSLARGQLAKKRLKADDLFVLRLDSLVASQRPLEHFQEFVFGYRLCQEILGAGFYRLHGGRNVSMGAYEYDG